MGWVGTAFSPKKPWDLAAPDHNYDQKGPREEKLSGIRAVNTECSYFCAYVQEDMG